MGRRSSALQQLLAGAVVPLPLLLAAALLPLLVMLLLRALEAPEL